MSTVEVLSVDGTVVDLVTNAPVVVEVMSTGIQGPPGGQTPPVVFTQSAAATEWIVNHNLGWEPLVEVLSLGGLPVIAGVIHMSTNQCRVTFSSPQSGRVLLR